MATVRHALQERLVSEPNLVPGVIQLYFDASAASDTDALVAHFADDDQISGLTIAPRH